MTILNRLELTQLARHYDRMTLVRAQAYAVDGSIGEVRVSELDHHRLVADAAVRGTRAAAYVVHLEVESHHGALEVESLCTCPIGFQCKHGAALALALGQIEAEPAPSADPPSWRSRMTRLLDDLDELAPPVEALAEVGLEVSLEPGRPGHHGRPGRPDQLQLRPLRRGKRGWVKTGLGWSDVAGARSRREHDLHQLDALLRLHQALLGQPAAHWYAGVAPPLAAFGPDVVPLLREAVGSGVTPVLRTPLVSLDLLTEPARPSADVTADAHAGTTRLRVGVDVAGELHTGDDVALLGDPAHTVSLLSEGRLVLAPLEQRLPARALRALRSLSTDPIVIPTDDTDDTDNADDLFDGLARLGRLVEVTSRDGSVPLPEAPAPGLRVTVTWDTASQAEVRWEWVYADTPLPLDGPTPASGTVARDRVAERALLAAVVPPPLAASYGVSGPDALHLALLELPVWRDTEGLEVVEVAAPSFRESEDTPTIAFEVADPVAGTGADPVVATEVENDWLDLHVVLTLEGESVPLPLVLEALTLGHEHLVLPSGLYLRTDRPELARLVDVVRAAAELRERRHQAAAGDEPVRVGRDDLGLWAQVADLGEVVDPRSPNGNVEGRASEWIHRAQALRDLVTLPHPEPTGIVSTLRGYQRDGFHWLAFLWQHRLGGILADDMGLGKTLQVLTLIAHSRRDTSDPFLVVAPTSVVSAWVGEAARHAPGLRVRAVGASSSRRAESIADLAAEADVVVTTYTLLRLDQDDYAAVSWAGLVLDEAQQVKNHRSQAYAAVQRIEAPFRLAVTGTPFENRLLELWSLLSIVAPGLYPRAKQFVDTVVRPVEKDGDDLALRRFTRRIRPFLLRRTKELVATDLPPLQEQVLDVELGPRHRKVYDAQLATERQRILGLVDDDFDGNRVAILAALTRLRQLALDPALVDGDLDHLGSAKLDLLVEHLREISAEGHRALVFSQFTGFLSRVRARLDEEHIDMAYLDGATQHRGQVIEQFRSGSAPVFLISLKAGGVGLTLTEADYVFVLDPWWNPAAEAQAVGRAHRIGQRRTVMVYRLVSTDTIEEKVMALKERKAALFTQVIDGGAGLSDAIGADDIRALFDQD